MNLSELLLKMAPVLLAAGVAYFVYRSNRQQRLAVLYGWLFPGAGHWWLGHRDRAKFVAGLIVGTFLVGLILAGFKCVSPLDRHPIWGLAQFPGGLLTILTALATQSLKIMEQNDYYNIGCLYTGCACLLNLIALCDVWDLGARGERQSPLPDPTPDAGGTR